MSVKSPLYAVSRIKILEGKLIDKDRINRMIEADTAEDAYRALSESSYGSAADVRDPREFERLISYEMKSLRELINEISTDEDLTDVLLMRYDYKNAKAYLKMRMCSEDVDDAISDAGKVPTRELREMVFQHDTYGLPEHLADAIDEAEHQISIDPNPNKVDNIMDRRYISWVIKTAKAKKNEFLIELYTEWIDMNNILSLLRVKQMKADVSLLKDVLLDGGIIDKQYIIDTYSSNDDMLPQKFRNTVYGHEMVSAIEHALKNKRAWIFEHYMENKYIEHAKKQKSKIFGIDPVISYIIAKENEATAIRMVMTGKINKLSADQIRERLRNLYA